MPISQERLGTASNLTGSLNKPDTIISGALLYTEPYTSDTQTSSILQRPLYQLLPVRGPGLCMPTGRGHRAHLPTLRRHSPGFGATGQAVLGTPTGTGHSGSERAGQAGAGVAWGRALVVATAQPSATWQVTWGAVAITAAAAALVAPTGLRVAALLVTPEAFVAGQQLVGLATGTTLVQHGSTQQGAGAVVAALCTAVAAAGQQLIACGSTWGCFLITCQPLILHLPGSASWKINNNNLQVFQPIA